MSARHARHLALCTLGLFWLVACSEPTGPGVEPEIRNIPDNFEFQVSRLTNYSGTLEYTWSNSGTLANVNHSAALASGNARLTVVDRMGVTLYSRDLTENGTYVTEPGEAGGWRIRVAFTGAAGDVNFRVQKRP